MEKYSVVFRLQSARVTLERKSKSSFSMSLIRRRAVQVMNNRSSSALREQNVRDTPRLDLSSVYVVESNHMGEASELLERLQNDEGVSLAFVAPPRDQLNVSRINPLNRLDVEGWHQQIKLPEAKNLKQWNGSTRVKVAIVDSGYDTKHPQLQRGSYTNHFGGGGAISDPTGHGTHVSGLIAAIKDPGNFFEGLAASCVDWEMHRGIPNDVAAYYRALRVASLAPLINLSLGGEYDDPIETEIIQDALTAGSIVVAAAGNSAEMGSPTIYPAALRGVLAVAAVDRAGKRYRTSNEGDYLFISAPGVDIVSTVPTHALPDVSGVGHPPLGAMSGTSMAAPIVTGIIARMLAYRTLPAQQVIDSIIGTGGGNGNRDVGRGVIDAFATLSAL